MANCEGVFFPPNYHRSRSHFPHTTWRKNLLGVGSAPNNVKTFKSDFRWFFFSRHMFSTCTFFHGGLADGFSGGTSYLASSSRRRQVRGGGVRIHTRREGTCMSCTKLLRRRDWCCHHPCDDTTPVAGSATSLSDAGGLRNWGWRAMKGLWVTYPVGFYETGGAPCGIGEISAGERGNDLNLKI